LVSASMCGNIFGLLQCSQLLFKHST
jgi:hypothetical protein